MTLRRKKKHPKHASLKPRKPVPKTNAARKAKTFAAAYHSPERVAWVRALPCAICARTPAENAHVHGYGGTGKKAPYTHILPLCHSCHTRYDAHGYGGESEPWFLSQSEITEQRWQAARKGT